MPPSDLGQGVLPRLIAGLVNRRRQVKGLMKDRKATPAQLLQVRFSLALETRRQAWAHHAESSVEYQTTSSQVDSQQYVRLSWFLSIPLLCATSCRVDNAQGARDFDSHEGAR